jgi:hypothetical protein
MPRSSCGSRPSISDFGSLSTSCPDRRRSLQ